MSRQQSTAILALLLLLFIGQALFAAPTRKAAVEGVTDVITADAGSFKQHGETLSMSFEKNVRMTSTQNDAILICQRLDADVQRGAITSAKAVRSVKSSLILTMIEDGVPVEYRIELTGASSYSTDGGKTMRLIGDAGKDAQLLMTPIGTKSKQSLKLTAKTLEYYPDAEDAATATDATPFMKAIGNVVVTAVTGNALAGYQELTGKAPQIVGLLRKTGDDDLTQFVRLERGGSAVRPHLERRDLNPAVPDNMVLDADSITFYPNAEEQWTRQVAEKVFTPVEAMRANGNVKATALLRSAVENPAPASKGKNTSSMRIPAVQCWQLENGTLSYKLERNKDDDAKTDHLLYISRDRDDALPSVVVTDLATKEEVFSASNDHIYVNVDNRRDFGAMSDEEMQKRNAGGNR